MRERARCNKEPELDWTRDIAIYGLLLESKKKRLYNNKMIIWSKIPVLFLHITVLDWNTLGGYGPDKIGFDFYPFLFDDETKDDQ